MIPDPSPYAPWFQIVIFFLVLFALIRPVGHYMAAVLEGRVAFLSFIEKAIYKVCATNPDEGMNAATYIKNLVVFSAVSLVTTFSVLVFQSYPDVSADLAFNAAVSFLTSTNWQPNVPETSIAISSQMFGLTVQNFVSPAIGLAVMAAVIRGLAQTKTETLGNFWADLTRSVLYILLPIAFVFALVIASQGVVQSFGETIAYQTLDGQTAQSLTTGPVASQIAIKQLGANGGGYYAANAAHPFENPTPLTNFLYLLAIALLPAAAPFTFAKMVGDPRQAKSILFAMFAIFIPLMLCTVIVESAGNPLLALPGIDQSLGNMEGKEMRFGAASSAFWASLTTATSSGSTNAALDSFLPLSGMMPLVLIQFGEIIFGGVGSGLFGMLVYVFLSVFIAGLMIGRTPEYLGKKIGVFEMQMSSLVLLIPVLAALIGTTLTVALPELHPDTPNLGAQSFSEILYAFSSASNNNGSAMAGMQANTPYFNIALGVCMLLGRFGVILPLLAIAGSMGSKITVAASPGTLNTTSFLFAVLLVVVIVLVDVVTYVPALAFGPVAEHLHLVSMVR